MAKEAPPAGRLQANCFQASTWPHLPAAAARARAALLVVEFPALAVVVVVDVERADLSAAQCLRLEQRAASRVARRCGWQTLKPQAFGVERTKENERKRRVACRHSRAARIRSPSGFCSRSRCHSYVSLTAAQLEFGWPKQTELTDEAAG